MKPLRVLLGSSMAALLAILLIGSSSCVAESASHAEAQQAGDVKQDGKPERVSVRLGEFVCQDIASKLAAAADLEAIDEAEVYPEVTGIVKEVRYREGAFASRDKPVVVLVDDELRFVEDNKKILVDQAKTKLQLAQVAKREADAMVKVKKLALQKAQREYDRFKKLEDNAAGVVSKEEVETKRFAVDEAQGNVITAELQFERSILQETQAQQDLELAKVALNTASLNLSRTQIKPPIDGYLSLLDLKPGELVNPTTLAFSIVSLDSLEVRLHVPQRDLARLGKGQKVSITCEVYPDKEFWGIVEVINPIIDKDTGTVRVIVRVNDSSGLLKPGMFINADVILDVHQKATLVPKKAVLYENRQPVIFLVENGVARRYVMTPGYSSQEYIEVLDLKGEDETSVDPNQGRLVLVGQNKLKDGVEVKILE